MTDIADRLRAALADRYDLERVLGAGGMATVYLARDLRHDRHVAVKVLHPDLAASIGAERFLREVAICSHLTHPHILPLHDSGDADGFLYYTMPFVEGESLRDRLRREKQLPLEDALGIACEVADALTHAHSHGVVHRDIKPENILLESGHAVVADFGVARAISAAGTEELTRTGLAIGTPAYMSPEQASGTRSVDGRSDVYSLGCVLFEMLAGDPPFTAATPQALIARKLNETLPRISVVREVVPPHVEAALGRAMARVPADRFRSAADFAAALRAQPWTPPAPPAAPVRPRHRAGRRLWLALPAVAVVATLGVLAWQVVRPRLAHRPSQRYGDVARWAAWKGWTGEDFPVVAVADSLLIVSARSGGTHAFDGRRWTTLRAPEGYELWRHIGPAAGGRLFGTRTVTGASGQERLEPWWMSLQRGELRPSRALPGFPFELGLPGWWSDGRELVVFGSSILRLAGDTWAGEATAISGAIRELWGHDANHRFALAWAPTDSLLVFDGISWRPVEPLEGRAPDSAYYAAAATFADGATVLVGYECDRQKWCRPLIVEQDRFGGRWHRVAIPEGAGIPTAPRRDTTESCDSSSFSLDGVEGRSRDDYVVSARWGSCVAGGPTRDTEGCPPGQPCYWASSGRGLEPVAELTSRRVAATVFVDDVAYALADDGTVWRRVGGGWRAVTRVPGLPERLVGVSRSLIVRAVGGEITYEPGRGDSLSRYFVSYALGAPPGVGARMPPRRLVVSESTAALLTADGSVFVSRCRFVRTTRNRSGRVLDCPRWEGLPPSPGRVEAITLLADGRVLGVGRRGLAVTWSGSSVRREALPAPAREDSLWDVVASPGGGVLAVGTRTLVRRAPDGTWAVLRRWGDAATDARLLVALPDGDVATAGSTILVWDRSSDPMPRTVLYRTTTVGPQVTALHALPDGRLVAGLSSPPDRLLGGQLMVWDRPARAGRSRRVDLPIDLDVTDLADDGEYLYVVGRGGALEIPIDSLPFAVPLRAPVRRSTVGSANH